MKLSDTVREAVLSADAKALATFGRHGLNVVPVSAVRVVGDDIWLMNFFFKKTKENIRDNPQASLVSWKGAEGYQVKGEVDYSESGKAFDEAKAWIAENLPKRTLRGLFIIHPAEVYKVSPSDN